MGGGDSMKWTGKPIGEWYNTEWKASGMFEHETQFLVS